MFLNDTIAAIATGMGNAGIGIIRISGSAAVETAEKVFFPINKNKKVRTMKSYTAAFGHIMDENQIIDEGILLVMKAPSTYTCEDVCELQCHGGTVVLKKVLDLVLKNGARAAEPGEFTKRAFLNGRIDLSQAESVMDLINAGNDFALQSSLSQLRGDLKDKIVRMREKIIYNTAFIESALDDPEHYSLDGYPQRLRKIVDKMIDDVDKLLKSYDNGRILTEGINTVIVGKPNAGKSTFLNTLLGEERAIVTDVAGTTRDTLEELININGIMLNVVDTAGIRSTDDAVEKIGVEKALAFVDKADLVLYIIDGSVELDDNDYKIISHIKEKKVICLINKTDKENIVDKMWIRRNIHGDVLEISAKNKTGIEKFHDTLNTMFFSGELCYNNQLYITNARHKEELEKAKESLVKVMESIDMGMGEDLFTIDLMEAYEHLGFIIGESVGDDLADKIFNDFCMGK